MGPPVAIDNPILNSPFEMPTRHYRVGDDNQITDEILTGRRESAHYVAVAQPKKQARKPATLFDELGETRVLNDFINAVRRRVDRWRELGHPDVTAVTKRLLEHWTDPARARRLFFCQIEAVETLIFITEVAKRSEYGDDWIAAELEQKCLDAGTDLPRVACKMATGSGKTVVMSMLIAWQTLNKRHNPKDNRFTDSFLVVAPGITIRDRLRVLLPSDREPYYSKLDLVPHDLRADLGSARIVITNFHAFQRREKGEAGGLTKRVLTANTPGAFTESEGEMVRRVCRELPSGRQVIVLNDEAHHCYRSKPESAEKLTGDDKKEADQREEEARLWISGVEAVNRHFRNGSGEAGAGVKAVYDLSATPAYLKGSGYKEGSLFGWVASDFSLVDAIEAGIVKIPRVPVSDNAMSGSLPTYRNLWFHIREGLPKKGRSAGEAPAFLPQKLEGALDALYGHYQTRFADWEADQEARAEGRTPPVFIVVCNNTAVSKLVFDAVAGRATEFCHPDGAAKVSEGKLPLFSNVNDGRWRARPRTILVDSEQFESGEPLSAEFRQLAALQIEEFKADYRERFPGRDADTLSDSDLMREVMNTVGKAGKLGEHVRCVVSVSMLTEGWDVSTVTHILGVRAFGTQLLCEQVVGRALRRESYVLNDRGHFDPEYADVFGIPFAFVPCADIGAKREPRATQKIGRVMAMPERLHAHPELEIRFPRVIGYRYEVPPDVLRAEFDDSHRLVLTTTDVPTRTENAPIVGETAVMTPDALKIVRPQAVAFKLAAHLQRYHFPDQVWLVPQLVTIVRRWMDEGHVVYGDETFPGLLLMAQKGHEAAEKLSRAISKGSGGAQRLRANLPERDVLGTTVGVGYDTLKTVWKTRPDKCHLNFVPEDSGWETKVVEKIERMDCVRAYVKNQNLNFSIPYTHEGRPGRYFPDLILKIDDGRPDLLNLVIEISGQELKEKQSKVETAKTLWLPAVNNEKQFGRWEFLEIDDPDRAMGAIEAFLKARAASKREAPAPDSIKGI